MLSYWLLSTFYGLAFYTIYHLFLRSRTTYLCSRYYMLITALLPLLLPLMVVPSLVQSVPFPSPQFTIHLPAIRIGNNVTAGSMFTLPQLLIIVYIVGAFIFLFRLILSYRQLRLMIRSTATTQSLGNGVTLLQQTGLGPGSFGSYVFIPDEQIHPYILQHELAHIRFRHSQEIIFVQVLKAVFWIFPAIYIVAAELRIIHEFEADSAVKTDPKQYANLLLSQFFGVKHIHIAHSFFHHPIKRRLVMLQQKTSSRTQMRNAIIRTVLGTIVLATGIIYLQSCNRPLIQSSNTKANNDNTEAFSTADVMPKPEYDLPIYLSNNIKYPPQAKEQNIQGRVIVKFVVDKSGNIINPSVLKSTSPLLSTEAIRVVQSMPPWIPGIKDGKNVPVNFFIPIEFKL